MAAVINTKNFRVVGSTTGKDRYGKPILIISYIFTSSGTEVVGDESNVSIKLTAPQVDGSTTTVADVSSVAVQVSEPPRTVVVQPSDQPTVDTPTDAASKAAANAYAAAVNTRYKAAATAFSAASQAYGRVLAQGHFGESWSASLARLEAVMQLLDNTYASLGTYFSQVYAPPVTADVKALGSYTTATVRTQLGAITSWQASIEAMRMDVQYIRSGASVDFVARQYTIAEAHTATLFSLTQEHATWAAPSLPSGSNITAILATAQSYAAAVQTLHDRSKKANVLLTQIQSVRDTLMDDSLDGLSESTVTTRNDSPLTLTNIRGNVASLSEDAAENSDNIQVAVNTQASQDATFVSNGLERIAAELGIENVKTGTLTTPNNDNSVHAAITSGASALAASLNDGTKDVTASLAVANSAMNAVNTACDSYMTTLSAFARAMNVVYTTLPTGSTVVTSDNAKLLRVGMDYGTTRVAWDTRTLVEYAAAIVTEYATRAADGTDVSTWGGTLAAVSKWAATNVNNDLTLALETMNERYHALESLLTANAAAATPNEALSLLFSTSALAGMESVSNNAEDAYYNHLEAMELSLMQTDGTLRDSIKTGTPPTLIDVSTIVVDGVNLLAGAFTSLGDATDAAGSVSTLALVSLYNALPPLYAARVNMGNALATFDNQTSEDDATASEVASIRAASVAALAAYTSLATSLASSVVSSDVSMRNQITHAATSYDAANLSDYNAVLAAIAARDAA